MAWLSKLGFAREEPVPPAAPPPLLDPDGEKPRAPTWRERVTDPSRAAQTDMVRAYQESISKLHARVTLKRQKFNEAKMLVNSARNQRILGEEQRLLCGRFIRAQKGYTAAVKELSMFENYFDSEESRQAANEFAGMMIEMQKHSKAVTRWGGKNLTGAIQAVNDLEDTNTEVRQDYDELMSQLGDAFASLGAADMDSQASDEVQWQQVLQMVDADDVSLTSGGGAVEDAADDGGHLFVPAAPRARPAPATAAPRARSILLELSTQPTGVPQS